MTLPPDEFLPSVNARVKEIKTANRKGMDPKKKGFNPVAFMQKMADIKKEYENPTVGPELIALTGAKTAEEGFKLGVEWTLHLDPESIKIQKAKYEEREARAKAEREKKKAEREKKKAEQEKKKEEEAAAAAAEAAA
jgi:hypothetical protein